MHVNVNLIILCIDLDNSTPQILLKDGSIPSTELIDHPFSVCDDICDSLLEIDTKGIEYVLVDVVYNNNLSLYYTCMIPEIIKLKDGNWKDIGVIKDEHIQKMVFKAGQTGISRRPFEF